VSYALATRSKASLGDRYLVLLSCVLMGYALVGKGFAYLGYPPVYIGEIAFSAGIALFLRSLSLSASLASWPSVVLAGTMSWVLLRTLPFLGDYGIDALRDSVVVMYGGFAFIVVALLLEDRRRILTLLQYYDKFVGAFIPVIPIVLALGHFARESVPHLPGSNVSLIEVRAEEAAVHLSGVVVFVVAGFRRMSLSLILPYIVSAVMVGVSSRGVMLAIIVPVVFAMLVLGKVSRLIAAIAFGLALFLAVYVVETATTDYQAPVTTAERSISTRQIMDNVASLFGSGGEQTEGTVTWRTDWWNIIIANTVYGPYFWTGRGFGINLAQADGFGAPETPNRPPLRSPHSVHMTLLARAGVPGLVLWGVFLASWFGMLSKALLAARRSGQMEWVGLFLFIGCYILAALIDASFDVALEGPMMGIWFWCLIGFGIGSVMTYHHSRE
jgi:hypothetical protein